MLGKQKCKILKEIRQRIADENDIPYVTRECGFQGECRGTCPRCESELRYLEKQLENRAALGKRVTVAALCASLAMGSVGCSPTRVLNQEDDLTGAMVPFDEPEPTEDPEIFVTSGEVAWPEEDDLIPPESGEAVWPEEETLLPPEDGLDPTGEETLIPPEDGLAATGEETLIPPTALPLDLTGDVAF